MQIRAALAAAAGPSAFAAAAFVGSRMEPGYAPRDEPISALAAHRTRSARVMVPGFLGLGLGTLGLAHALRGSRTAPAPVPALLALAGVTTLGAGLARCSDRTCPTRGLDNGAPELTDDLHAGFSGATFTLWTVIPLVAAARARGAPAGFRRWSRCATLATFGGLVAVGGLARRTDSRGSGAAQRAMLASVFGWYLLAAAYA